MYYVTKYALSDGIWLVKAEDGHESEGYLYVGELGHSPIQVKKSDWFTTPEAAHKRVQQLVEAKLRSLERSTNKLKHLDITYSKEWKSGR